jgi:hypothetical protein
MTKEILKEFWEQHKYVVAACIICIIALYFLGPIKL